MKINKNIIIYALLILTIFAIIGGVSANDLITENLTSSDANTKTISVEDSSNSANDNPITSHSIDTDKLNDNPTTPKSVDNNNQINDNQIKSKTNDEKLGNTDTIYVAPNEDPEYGEGTYDKPFSKISNAINLAKTSSGKIIIKEGNYHENGITIDGNKAISIIGEGQVIMDNTGLDKNSIFTIETKDLTIKNIIFRNNEANKHGSAFYIVGESENNPLEVNILIENCSFENLKASRGGAIYTQYTKGNLSINNCNFTKINTSSWGTICAHTCEDGSGLNLKINNSNFITNYANNGGALHLTRIWNVTITHTSFYNNTAEYDGAAIQVSRGNLTLDNCVIYNNTASKNKVVILVSGGQIFKDGSYTMAFSNIKITNSIIENNNAKESKVPTIRLEDSNMDISYSSIVNEFNIENTVTNTYNFEKPGNLTANNNWWGTNNPFDKINGTNIKIDNWVVMNVVTNVTKIDPGDTVKFTIDFNHVQTTSGEIEDLIGGMIPKENYFIHLSAEKGSLSSESLNIINGETKEVIYTSTTLPDTVTITSDEFVSKTILKDKSEPYYGIIYVSKSGNDDNDGSYEAPVANINKAIELASLEGASGQIIISEGIYSGHDYIITKNLTITGQGNVVIDAEGEGRLFYIPSDYEVDKFYLTNLTLSGSNNDILYSFAKESILDNINIINNPGDGDLITIYGNLTIKNSKISGHNGGDIIYSSISSLKTANIIINNTIFENNMVTASTSDYGIIYLSSGKGNLIIENSQFINNTQRHSVITGSNYMITTVKNSTFINNTATVGYGGAIRVSSELNVKDSTFINNHASRDGGAIHVALNANAIITKSSFINNSAGPTYHGNSIYNNGKLSINYCILLDNNTIDYIIYNENTKKIVDAQYNWWGTNDNPEELVSKKYDDDEEEYAEINTSNWVIMNLNIPDTVYTGFKVKISADFNHYINGSQIKELEETIPGINVNVSAINGSLDNNMITSINGIASVTYTSKDESGEDIISFTTNKFTLSKKIIIEDQTQNPSAIVSPEKINSFFNDKGILEDSVEFKELIFVGEFNNLNLTINKPINITGVNALFKNTALIIESNNVNVTNITFIANEISDEMHSTIYICADDIIIKNNTINYNAKNASESYAIYLVDSNRIQLINNRIIYLGNLCDPIKETIGIYGIDSSDLTIKNNNIAVSIPSVDVNYDEKTIYSAGLLLENSENIHIENNNITVNYNKEKGDYATTYAVKIINGDNLEIIKNNLEINGHKYTYGLSIDGSDLIIRENNISSNSDDYYSAGLEIAGNSEGIIKYNRISAKSKDVTYGIYAENYGDIGSELTIEDNNITAQSNTAYGMILVSKKLVKIENNNIRSQGNYTTSLGFKSGSAEIINNTIYANGSNTGTSTDLMPIEPLGTRGLYILDASVVIKNNTINSTSNYTILAINSKGPIKDNVLNALESKGDKTIKNETSDLEIDNNNVSGVFENPIEPDNPNNQTEPDTPTNPDTPNKPTQPDTPDTPTEPEKPNNPSSETNTEKPIKQNKDSSETNTELTSTDSQKVKQNSKSKKTKSGKSTANKIIIAKNLKIKKSTKSLKIKVKLKKLNKKLLKNKKVTVKFRGKTYKSKPNKKGIVIFKIPKKVLKKLKVGKSYKYIVKYGKYKVTKKIIIRK